MFDIDRFAANCRAALAQSGTEAIRDVVRRAVSDPAALIAALGEHNGPHAAVLVRAPDLTILNAVWGERQWTLPHNHHHRGIIGMYGGGEDNIFWRRLPEDGKGRVARQGNRGQCQDARRRDRADNGLPERSPRVGAGATRQGG